MLRVVDFYQFLRFTFTGSLFRGCKLPSPPRRRSRLNCSQTRAEAVVFSPLTSSPFWGVEGNYLENLAAPELIFLGGLFGEVGHLFYTLVTPLNPFIVARNTKGSITRPLPQVPPDRRSALHGFQYWHTVRGSEKVLGAYHQGQQRYHPGLRPGVTGYGSNARPTAFGATSEQTQAHRICVRLV